MQLELAMIFVKDMPRMTAFYRDGLGLQLVLGESSAEWAVFEAGGARLALHAIPPAIAAGITIADPADVRSETPIKLVFRADDLDAACARLVALGAQLLPARATERRDLVDPEGNVLQLTT